MNITKGLIENLYNHYKDRFGGNIHNYFAWLYLSKTYDLPVEELMDMISFRDNEAGIDAFYIDTKLKHLYLYQFKWSDDCSQFKDALVKLKEQGMRIIFGDDINYNLSKFISRMKEQIQYQINHINRVSLCLVYNGNVDEAQNSMILKSLCEDLESKKYFIDDFFGKEIKFSIQFSSNETKDLREVVKNIATYRYTIDFSNSIQHSNNNGENLNIGFMRLVDLRNMYKEMKYRLFDKNIRFGLSPDNAPNKSIKKSLINMLAGKETPQEFTFNHNGMTLYVERIELFGDKAEIVEPRILNGAQTITVFDNFIRSNEGNKDFKKNAAVLDEIKVLCKIISNADSNFVTNVTICTNKQNPVEPWNLRASDFIQLQFDDKFRRELGIFYERQENAFESLQEMGFEGTGVNQDKAIQIRKLAQTFLAVQGEIEKISRLTDLFESDSMYQNTFRPSYLKTDARLILMLYKIQYRLPSIIKEIKDRGQNKYAYINRARNLIWSLLAQGILNEPRLDDMVPKYGTSITMENDFAEYLKDMASRRIRPIISEISEIPQYAELIEKNSFAFFRTRAIYNKAMEIARHRYEWIRKGLIPG